MHHKLSYSCWIEATEQKFSIQNSSGAYWWHLLLNISNLAMLAVWLYGWQCQSVGWSRLKYLNNCWMDSWSPWMRSTDFVGCPELAPPAGPMFYFFSEIFPHVLDGLTEHFQTFMSDDSSWLFLCRTTIHILLRININTSDDQLGSPLSPSNYQQSNIDASSLEQGAL